MGFICAEPRKSSVIPIFQKQKPFGNEEIVIRKEIYTIAII